MAIIDSQIHAYERDHPGRPWRAKIAGAEEVTGDDHLAAMDSAGVDGAVLVSPWVLYRTDTSYAEQVRNAYPDRFAMVAPMDPSVSGVGEAIVDWAATPGAVGIRLMVGFTDEFRADDPGVKEAVHAAERHDLPVCVFCWGKLAMMHELAMHYPDAQLVIDHLGVPQPLAPPPPTNPFADLDDVLALARFENVAIKVSGACTLSHRPFPFDDLWEPMSRVFEAFGVERCMWGTDWTRAVQLVQYPESVTAFREAPGLSSDERDALMGGSLSRIFGWSPSR